MPISMSRSAHYVTQSSIYDCPMLGPLTDRKIAKYAKQGRYGEEYKAQRKERIAKEQAKKQNEKQRRKSQTSLINNLLNSL